MNLLYHLQPGVTGVVAVIFLILVVIIRIAFAAAVKQDGDIICMKGSGTFLVPPVIWSLATLLGGVMVAVGYWVVHHSTLRANWPPLQTNKRVFQQPNGKTTSKSSPSVAAEASNK